MATFHGSPGESNAFKFSYRYKIFIMLLSQELSGYIVIKFPTMENYAYKTG